MKKSKLDSSYYRQLLADQYDLLRHAFESFLSSANFSDGTCPRFEIFQRRNQLFGEIKLRIPWDQNYVSSVFMLECALA